jgi:protein arginine kinase activator
MLCHACKERTATIHLTEITNGQRVETHLCQECAQQQGLAIKAQIPLNELLNTLLSTQPQPAADAGPSAAELPNKACPDCKMTLMRFSKESLLGCPNDYKVFEDELLPLIERSHNGKSWHCGKVPTHASDEEKKNIRSRQLQRQLEAAIKNEDYETAARLRDEIKQTL